MIPEVGFVRMGYLTKKEVFLWKTSPALLKMMLIFFVAPVWSVFFMEYFLSMSLIFFLMVGFTECALFFLNQSWISFFHIKNSIYFISSAPANLRVGRGPDAPPPQEFDPLPTQRVPPLYNFVIYICWWLIFFTFFWRRLWRQ